MFKFVSVIQIRQIQIKQSTPGVAHGLKVLVNLIGFQNISKKFKETSDWLSLKLLI